MHSKSHTSTLWLFTEHRNATFIINFELPKQTASEYFNVHFESWSSEEVADIGIDAMTTALQAKANETLPQAAIFSRYVLPHGQTLISLCKSLGIVTLFHLDDLLQQLPIDIGQKYAATYSETYKSALDACIRASDGILASTPILAAQIAKLYPLHSIQTVLGVCYDPGPGWTARAVRSRIARFKRRLTSVGIQTLGYMGSSSHLRDLATITPQIAALMRTRPSLHFETLGLPAPDVLKAEFGDRIRQYGFTSTYSDFLTRLYEVRWDLGMAPLVRDDFNQSKTFTKFIEYTASGIPTLAEDIAPYSHLARDHRAIALATGSAWVRVADHLLSNASTRRDQLQRAQTLCKTTFTGSLALEHLIKSIEQFTTIHNQE
jgi:hypothetical protein